MIFNNPWGWRENTEKRVNHGDFWRLKRVKTKRITLIEMWTVYNKFTTVKPVFFQSAPGDHRDFCDRKCRLWYRCRMNGRAFVYDRFRSHHIFRTAPKKYVCSHAGYASRGRDLTWPSTYSSGKSDRWKASASRASWSCDGRVERLRCGLEQYDPFRQQSWLLRGNIIF